MQGLVIASTQLKPWTHGPAKLLLPSAVLLLLTGLERDSSHEGEDLWSQQSIV